MYPELGFCFDVGRMTDPPSDNGSHWQGMILIVLGLKITQEYPSVASINETSPQ